VHVPSVIEPRADPSSTAPARWAKVIDQTRCIGCHACTTACKSENEVPLSVTRTYVKYVDVGIFPQARRAFQDTRCNQCD
jgi:Fe-S-cluster-containing dehydrogenase component